MALFVHFLPLGHFLSHSTHRYRRRHSDPQTPSVHIHSSPYSFRSWKEYLNREPKNDGAKNEKLCCKTNVWRTWRTYHNLRQKYALLNVLVGWRTKRKSWRRRYSKFGRRNNRNWRGRYDGYFGRRNCCRSRRQCVIDCCRSLRRNIADRNARNRIRWYSIRNRRWYGYWEVPIAHWIREKSPLTCSIFKLDRFLVSILFDLVGRLRLFFYLYFLIITIGQRLILLVWKISCSRNTQRSLDNLDVQAFRKKTTEKNVPSPLDAVISATLSFVVIA